MVTPGAAPSILAATAPQGQFFVEHAKELITPQSILAATTLQAEHAKRIAQSESLTPLRIDYLAGEQRREAGLNAFTPGAEESVVDETGSRQIFTEDNPE